MMLYGFGMNLNTPCQVWRYAQPPANTVFKAPKSNKTDDPESANQDKLDIVSDEAKIAKIKMDFVAGRVKKILHNSDSWIEIMLPL